jgi:hypothetical protein
MRLKKEATTNNEEFWILGIHPFNSPLPKIQNGKRNLKIFLKLSYCQKTKEKEYIS